MRQLPPNPNLSHLKQQAKTLLAAMRETDPTATLSAAQRALAERHGFRSWSDLKIEVDRRPANPAVPDTGLIEAIAAAFALGEPIGTGTVTAHDPQGQVIDFDTTSGSWTAHQVFDWVNDAQVARAVRLIEAAAERGLPTPVPRGTPSGRWVAQVDGRHWRVDEAIELGPPVPTPAPSS